MANFMNAQGNYSVDLEEKSEKGLKIVSIFKVLAEPPKENISNLATQSNTYTSSLTVNSIVPVTKEANLALELPKEAEKAIEPHPKLITPSQPITNIKLNTSTKEGLHSNNISLNLSNFQNLIALFNTLNDFKIKLQVNETILSNKLSVLCKEIKLII